MNNIGTLGSSVIMGYLEYINASGISKEKIDNLILNYFIVEGYQEAAISFAKEINIELKNERIKSHSPSLNPFIKQLGSMSSMNNSDFAEVALNYFEKNETYDSNVTPHNHHHPIVKPKIISDYSTINQRKEIKLLILKGSITDAIQKVSEYFPTILDSNNLLHFKLLRLNLIEMIRNHKLANGNIADIALEKKFLDDILTFVRENLINKVTHSSRLLKELEITMSLLCFNFDADKSIEEQKDLPEELRSLFNLSLRNQCYRLVNKAILNLYYNEETIEENGNVNGNVNRNNQGLYNGEIENNKIYKGPKHLEFNLLGFDKFEAQEKDIEMIADDTSDMLYDYNLKYDENIAHINANNQSQDSSVSHDDNLQDELQDLSLESKLERIIKLWTIAEQRLVDLNFRKSKQYEFTDGNL